MAINENELQLIQIGDFPETETMAGSGAEYIVIRKADGTTYRMSTSDFVEEIGISGPASMGGVVPNTSFVPDMGSVGSPAIYFAGPGVYPGFGGITLTEPLNVISWDSVSAVVKGIPINLTGYQNITDKQNTLNTDGTGTKYPTVDAVNAELRLKKDVIKEGVFSEEAKGKAGVNITNLKKFITALECPSMDDTMFYSFGVLAGSTNTTYIRLNASLNKDSFGEAEIIVDIFRIPTNIKGEYTVKGETTNSYITVNNYYKIPVGTVTGLFYNMTGIGKHCKEQNYYPSIVNFKSLQRNDVSKNTNFGEYTWNLDINEDARYFRGFSFKVNKEYAIKVDAPTGSRYTLSMVQKDGVKTPFTLTEGSSVFNFKPLVDYDRIYIEFHSGTPIGTASVTIIQDSVYSYQRYALSSDNSIINAIIPEMYFESGFNPDSDYYVRKVKFTDETKTKIQFEVLNVIGSGAAVAVINTIVDVKDDPFHIYESTHAAEGGLVFKASFIINKNELDRLGELDEGYATLKHSRTFNKRAFVLTDNKIIAASKMIDKGSSDNQHLATVIPEMYFESGFNEEERYYVRELKFSNESKTRVTFIMRKAGGPLFNVINMDFLLDESRSKVYHSTLTTQGVTFKASFVLNKKAMLSLGNVDANSISSYIFNKRAYDVNKNKIIAVDSSIGKQVIKNTNDITLLKESGGGGGGARTETIVLFGENSFLVAPEGSEAYEVSTDVDINLIFDALKDNVNTTYTVYFYGNISIVEHGINKYPHFNLIGRGCSVRMSNNMGVAYRNAIRLMGYNTTEKKVSHNRTYIEGFKFNGNFQNQTIKPDGSYLFNNYFGSGIQGGMYNDDVTTFTDTQIHTNLNISNCTFVNFIRSGIVSGSGWDMQKIVIENSAQDHGLYLVEGKNITARDVEFRGHFDGNALTVSSSNLRYQIDPPKNMLLENFRFYNITSGGSTVQIRGLYSDLMLYESSNITCRDFYIINDEDHPFGTYPGNAMIHIGAPAINPGEPANNNIRFENLNIEAHILTKGVFHIENTSNVKISGRIVVNKTSNINSLIKVKGDRPLYKVLDISNTDIHIKSEQKQEIILFDTSNPSSTFSSEGIVLDHTRIHVEGSGGGDLFAAKKGGVEIAYTLYNTSLIGTTGNVALKAPSSLISFGELGLIKIT